MKNIEIDKLLDDYENAVVGADQGWGKQQERDESAVVEYRNRIKELILGQVTKKRMTR